MAKLMQWDHQIHFFGICELDPTSPVALVLALDLSGSLVANNRGYN